MTEQYLVLLDSRRAHTAPIEDKRNAWGVASWLQARYPEHEVNILERTPQGGWCYATDPTEGKATRFSPLFA